MPRLILGWNLFTVDRLEFYNQVNLMKGGLVFADWITTVSRKYAQEIQTAEYGFGLDTVVRRRAANLTGILNGVNYQEWNPETDPWIPFHYSAKELKGKEQCKLDLLKEFGLSDAHADWPLIGIVSRFAVQKGFDLIAEVTGNLLKQDVLMVVLGTGDPEYEALFRDFHTEYPDKLGLKIVYSNPLAHKIEAGADIFLMPSHYEPCGLNQIYSLKYGTVPIVRATGGLDDTIENWDPRTGRGTGFKFTKYSGDAMMTAVHNAIQAFKDQEGWRKLMRNSMNKDFSWNASAREYGKVYERVRQLRTANHSAPEKVLVS